MDFNINQDAVANAKKNLNQRRTIDISSPALRSHILLRQGLSKFLPVEPESSYSTNILTPNQYLNRSRVINIANKFVHLSSNKVKHVISSIAWTPEGRRLVVATYNGEISLWNGNTFSFESIMQAHDTSVSTIKYSNAGDWFTSGDSEGTIKIWQPNFNMVKEINNAHSETIRDISFNKSDSKFVTCSDDNILKIWNFSNGKQERILSGHHWDIKSCDWHPEMGLIASASKDNLVKLWDPRSGQCVSTLLNFKHTVLKIRFQPTRGNYLVGISKDKSCRVFDLRNHMKEIMSIRDEVDQMALTWHPINESMFTLASYDGCIKHFDLLQDLEKPIQTIPYAHEKCVTSIAYSPIGHLLASASKDRSIRFWARAKPVDPNAYDDPTYNNQKPTNWYYGINNNINAVREKTEFGAAPPPAEDENNTTNNTVSENGSPVKNPTPAGNPILPGLDLGNTNGTTLPGLSI